jgi:Raf kinase inhibitor-like YbhB/YbcL family protein
VAGAPSGTKSLALTLFDPDAPTGHGFSHWVVFDIPATVSRLAAGAGYKSPVVKGAVSGRNDLGTDNYAGPCRPPGTGKHLRSAPSTSPASPG